ncbi:MAG: hypothetical protein WAM97_20580 [Acidimicrobiales bacterium]
MRFRGGRDTQREGCQADGAVRVGFDEHASFYMDAYRSYQTAMALLRECPPESEVDLANQRAKLFTHRVRARWALAVRGAESVPFAVEMLKGFDLEEREDGRGILSRIGDDDRVIDTLNVALSHASSREEFESLTVALGATGNLKATPVLIRILRHPDTDESTRSAAMMSIGRIAKRRFDHALDPQAALQGWLDANGYRSLVVYGRADLQTADESSAPEQPAAELFDDTQIELSS